MMVTKKTAKRVRSSATKRPKTKKVTARDNYRVVVGKKTVYSGVSVERARQVFGDVLKTDTGDKVITIYHNMKHYASWRPNP